MTRLQLPTAELISRYSTAGPRYTSYPTAAEFTDSFGADEWSHDLENFFDNPANPRKLALYVHVPFCKELCYYCACNKVISKSNDVVPPFLQALSRESELYLPLLTPQDAIVELHLGGGTPNFLAEADLAALFATLSRFPLDTTADISLEIDPRTLRRSQLEVLRTCGFNRLSMGVQDFDQHVQEVINRRQSVEQTRDAIEWARGLGFKSVNVDLIYGLPEQSMAGFERTLAEVVTLLPERISLFGYAHVTWISKTQRTFARAHVPSPTERLELFSLAIEKLAAAGYEHIGLDHFALPHDDLCRAREEGQLSRNFMGYTARRSDALIALGPSAISSIPTAFAQNEKDLNRYYERLSSARFPTMRGVKRTLEDQLRGRVIEDLLCFGETNLATLPEAGTINFQSHFASELDRLTGMKADGLLEFQGSSIRVLPAGQFFLRNIAMVFDAHLSKHQSGSRPVFSQTV